MLQGCCNATLVRLFLSVSRLTSQSSPFKVVFPLNYSFANRETCTKQTSQCSGFQAVKSDVKLDRTDTLVIQACFEAEFLRFEFVWMLLWFSPSVLGVSGPTRLQIARINTGRFFESISVRYIVCCRSHLQIVSNIILQTTKWPAAFWF